MNPQNPRPEPVRNWPRLVLWTPRRHQTATRGIAAATVLSVLIELMLVLVRAEDVWLASAGMVRAAASMGCLALMIVCAIQWNRQTTPYLSQWSDTRIWRCLVLVNASGTLMSFVRLAAGRNEMGTALMSLALTLVSVGVALALRDTHNRDLSQRLFGQSNPPEGTDLKPLWQVGAHREEQLLLAQIGDGQDGVIPEPHGAGSSPDT